MLLHFKGRMGKEQSLINSGLSIKSSVTTDISRLFGNWISKPYTLSLIFSLTGRNKGNFLSLADHLIQQPGRGTLGFPRRVGVDVHCGTDIGVSEKFLHVLGRGSVGQKIARECVPLRYNYGNTQKSSNCNGYKEFERCCYPFSKPKNTLWKPTQNRWCFINDNKLNTVDGVNLLLPPTIKDAKSAKIERPFFVWNEKSNWEENANVNDQPTAQAPNPADRKSVV